jgi:hypothetical protein
MARRDSMRVIRSAVLPKEMAYMKTSTRVLNILMRVFGGAVLALGLAFWLGYARSLTLLHIRFGIGVVPGPLHWIVQVAHLGVGIVAIALGAQLASAISLGRASPAQPHSEHYAHRSAR